MTDSANHLEQFTSWDPEGQERAAMVEREAARVRNSSGTPSKIAVEKSILDPNSLNVWSAHFLRSLSFPNGVTLEQVSQFNHLERFRLSQVLSAHSTIEVTSEILAEATEVSDQTTQLNLPLEL